MRTLLLALLLALVPTLALADDVCRPAPPESRICLEFRARAVESADVERLAVRLRSAHLDARRRGNTVLARATAEKAAEFLAADVLTCGGDGGAPEVRLAHPRIPSRYRHDVVSVRAVACD